MEVLFREAKFKIFFLFLGVPFVLLGTFGFVFMGVSLGFDFPPPYMCLIFPIVGCIVISFDIKAWARYFKGKKIVKDGTDGTAVFLSYFRSNYYIKHHAVIPHKHQLNYYGVVFSFTDANGNTVKQKTSAFLHPNETEALRRLGEFGIKYINATAVITHDLKQVITENGLEEVTHLE